MIIYFDFQSRKYNIESSRSGHSKLTTWRPLDHGIFLKDVSFGVVNHPFNPGEISFRRKTFTPYKPTDMGGKDYGIAIKGTAIHEDEYNNLVVDTNPIPITVRKLFHRYGEKFYQSYPSLVKYFKAQDKMSNATMSPSLTGTREYTSFTQISIRSNKCRRKSCVLCTKTYPCYAYHTILNELWYLV
jgi:hypothetical protein